MVVYQVTGTGAVPPWYLYGCIFYGITGVVYTIPTSQVNVNVNLRLFEEVSKLTKKHERVGGRSRLGARSRASAPVGN